MRFEPVTFLSCLLLIPCQRTNSTKSLSLWLRPQEYIYTLSRPLTQEPFGLEEWMQHRPPSYLARNIPLRKEGRMRFELVTFLSRWLLIPCQRTNSTKSLSFWLSWSLDKYKSIPRASTINLSLSFWLSWSFDMVLEPGLWVSSKLGL